MLDYGKLQERFNQDARELEARPLPTGLEATAVGYWCGYPTFLKVLDAGLEDHGEPMPPAYWAARDALKFAHYQAAQALVGLAEQVGLDGGPIWTASRICQEMFPETERVISGFEGCEWPEGWASQIDKLPADTREAVRRGYETLIRLSERLGVSQSGPPDNLLTELTKDQRKIFGYLWQQPRATVLGLLANVWAPRVVEDATVQRAIERLNDRLLDLTQGRISVENSGQFVVLKRLDK